MHIISYFAYFFPSFVIFIFIWRDLVLHQGLKSLMVKWVLYLPIFALSYLLYSMYLSLRVPTSAPSLSHSPSPSLCVTYISFLFYFLVCFYGFVHFIILLIFSLLSVSWSWLCSPTLFFSLKFGFHRCIITEQFSFSSLYFF